MPWTDHSGPTPHRSQAQLLEAVRERAGAIRRARRARLSAAIGGVLALLVVATALARAGDDPSTKLEVAGPVTTTTAPATTLTAQATTTTPAAVSTTIRVPTTVPPTTARTTRPEPTTTVPKTTTTAPDVRVACEASDVVVTATPDRSTYPQGAKVVVTAAAVNRGSRLCFPYDPSVQFFNAAGAGVGGGAVVDAFTMPVPGGPLPTWDPGEKLSMPFDWAQLCVEGGTCPPGRYTVVATFGPFRSAPAPFTIT